MTHIRLHGTSPFTVAVLHGGPGAPGSAAPLARALAHDRGVIEPLQTAYTIAGQVDELRAALDETCQGIATIVGWSWGAMLGFIFAARHPAMTKKLILVSSGVFDEQYAAGITAARLSRLGGIARLEAERLLARLGEPDSTDAELQRMGALLEATDAYAPLPPEPGDEDGEVQAELHRRVWAEAVALRRSGDLVALGRDIRCPVVAIHGDCDPHPVEGVRAPLQHTVRDFRMIVLPRCGHTPWAEREAREPFFDALRRELGPMPT